MNDVYKFLVKINMTYFNRHKLYNFFENINELLIEKKSHSLYWVKTMLIMYEFFCLESHNLVHYCVEGRDSRVKGSYQIGEYLDSLQ